MEKGLLFLTLSVACVWLILDDFYGAGRLTLLSRKITPDVHTPLDTAKEKVEETKNNYDKNKKEYLKRDDTLQGKFRDKYGPA